jgi:hypothetical protein
MTRGSVTLATSAASTRKLSGNDSSDFAYWAGLLVLLVILAALWLVPLALTAANPGSLVPTDPTILGASA